MPNTTNSRAARVPISASVVATTIHAAVSLVLLVGFYVLAAACALGVATLTVVLAFKAHGPALAKIIVIGGGVSVAIVIAVGKSLKTHPFKPHGTRLSKEDAPELWTLVEDAARRVGTRPPDEISLVPEVNAAIVEKTRLLGLIGGRRYLALGLPLLAAMSTDQVRAILAHELGHYSHAHTKLTALSYRGHIAIGEMMAQFAHRKFNPLTWLFMGYAMLFALVQSAVSRRQELAADHVAGRIAGRAAMQSALGELEALDRLWDFYFDEYVRLGLHRGLAPRGVFTGFSSLLDGRSADLEELRGLELPTKTSVWDTHPPIAARIAALATAPETGEISDDRPATALLPDFPATAGRMESDFIDFGNRRVLEWPDYAEQSYLAGARSFAESAYRAIGRVAGHANLNVVLDMLEVGDGESLLAALRQTNFPQQGFDAILETCAYDSGAVRFELHWDGPFRLTRPNGEVLDVVPIVEAINSATPDGAARARALLTEYGIELARPVADGTAVPTIVLGAVANVQYDEQPHDVLLTDHGMLFLPCAQVVDFDAGRRLYELVNHPDGVKGLMDLPGAKHLPDGEISGATIQQNAPLRAMIHMRGQGGHEIAESWAGTALGDGDKALRDLVRSYAERHAPA